MIIRVRSQVGVWRVADLSPETTVRELRARLSKEHNVDLMSDNAVAQQPLTLKPDVKGEQPALPLDSTLGALGLQHGDMLHLKLSGDMQSMAHEEAQGPKKINADGTIVQQSYDEISSKTGFRPGMMSLRSMKMKWTLNDFMDMNDKYTFKMKRQEKAICAKVTLDTASCNNFQSYVRQFGFHQARMGYLYGHFLADNQVQVECIYEPPQHNYPHGFEVLEDPNEARVEQLAALLKLQKVGWIFAHPPREEGFLFSSAEVITAAEFQLEAADGIKDTPFVTVKVTADAEGKAHFDAFQVSTQCMEMVAEGALEVGTNPGSCSVAKMFTAVVEAKDTPEVDNSFFLTVVPIEQHESERFVNLFPRAGREGTPQTWDDVKRQLSKAGKEGFTYVDMLSDFHLLLFLTQFLDMASDMPKICAAVVDRQGAQLDDGHKLLINHMAGLEN